DLVPFGSVEGFAEKLSDLLEDDELREERAMNAYHAGRRTIWKRSGERYLKAFNDSLTEARNPKPAQRLNVRTPRLSAIKRMSASCSNYELGGFGVPDRPHGCCIDDVARALIFTQWARKAGLHDPSLD